MTTKEGLPAGGGEAGQLLHNLDWSRHPLGPPALWPPELRTLVGVLLAANQPMFVVWGAEQSLLYNDGYGCILGALHPAAQGRPFFAVWDHLRADVGPILTRAYAGEATSMDDIGLVLQRNGYPEEAHFSFFYAPVWSGDGSVAGVFCSCTDITERVLGERRLAAAAAREQRLYDGAPGFVAALYGPEHRFRFVNQAWRRLIGRDVAGQPARQALAGDAWQRLVASLDGVFATGQSAQVPDLPLAPAGAAGRGSQRRIDFIIAPVLDDSGRVVGVTLQGTDGTAAYQAREALRSSERRFRAAMAAIGTLWTNTADGLMQGPQPGWTLLTGQTESVYTGYGWTSAIHPEDVAGTVAAWQAAVTAGTTFVFEHRVRACDGLWRSFSVRAVPVVDDEGGLVEWVGVHIDITERLAFERSLQESESRFRNLSDHAPVMIWVTRADGHCEHLNQRWLSFTGQTLEQALGFGWLEAVHPEDAPAAEQAFLQANAARLPFSIEYRLRRHDGEYRWCIDAALPRQASDGQALGYIGSVIDISDRKRLEAALTSSLVAEQSARAEAERSGRMKDEFLATLSHELRTPLSSILGWVAVIQRQQELAAPLRQGVEVIERNARAQAQIIADLLDMSAIAAGRVELAQQAVDLRELAALAVESSRPAAAAKQVAIVLELPVSEGVPANGTASGSLSTVAGDPHRLQQVLWNLLTNAIKFTPTGGRVSVGVTGDADGVELRVSDNGEGIAPAFLPFVFDRFRQEDASTTRRHGGLGLGLSIVKKLVELHAGTVAVDSAGLGHGASFSVRLPAAPPPAPGSLPPPSPTETLTNGRDPALTGLRVLLVDDDADGRLATQHLLLRAGAIVTGAGSATEAMGLITQHRFELLVSDLGMPQIDGYGLIEWLRARPAREGGGMPAVALTAYARPEDRTRALQAGFQQHVAKPVDAARLLSVVAALAADLRAG